MLETFIDSIFLELFSHSLRSVSANGIAAKPSDACVVSSLKLILAMNSTFPDEFLDQKAW